jgi:cell pole-organizing protein PopZ
MYSPTTRANTFASCAARLRTACAHPAAAGPYRLHPSSPRAPEPPANPTQAPHSASQPSGSPHPKTPVQVIAPHPQAW